MNRSADHSERDIRWLQFWELQGSKLCLVESREDWNWDTRKKSSSCKCIIALLEMSIISFAGLQIWILAVQKKFSITWRLQFRRWKKICNYSMAICWWEERENLSNISKSIKKRCISFSDSCNSSAVDGPIEYFSSNDWRNTSCYLWSKQRETHAHEPSGCARDTTHY